MDMLGAEAGGTRFPGTNNRRLLATLGNPLRCCHRAEPLKLTSPKMIFKDRSLDGSLKGQGIRGSPGGIRIAPDMKTPLWRVGDPERRKPLMILIKATEKCKQGKDSSDI